MTLEIGNSIMLAQLHELNLISMYSPSRSIYGWYIHGVRTVGNTMVIATPRTIDIIAGQK